MSDRTLFWGETTEGARYQSGDSDPEGGDFIVAKNTDNETVLLQWNQTATEWEFAGAVDMGGNNLTNAGLVSGVDGSFDTLEAESTNVNDYSLRKGVLPTIDIPTDEPLDATIDVSQIEGDDVIIIEASMGQELRDLKLRINNESDDNYTNIYRDGTSLTTESTSEFSFWKQTNTSSGAFGEWKLSSPRRIGTRYFGIFGSGVEPRDGSPILIEGGLETEPDDTLDSIQLFTDETSNTGGWISLSVEERS